MFVPPISRNPSRLCHDWVLFGSLSLSLFLLFLCLLNTGRRARLCHSREARSFCFLTAPISLNRPRRLGQFRTQSRSSGSEEGFFSCLFKCEMLECLCFVFRVVLEYRGRYVADVLLRQVKHFVGGSKANGESRLCAKLR